MKRYWKVYIAILLGGAIAIYGGIQYKVYVNSNLEKISVIVAASDIKPYTMIRESDLTEALVVKGTENENRCIDMREVLGKVTIAEIKKGEQILKNNLVSADLVQDRSIVALNISTTRVVGGWARPGDFVDVWWIKHTEDVPGAEWFRVATNAKLLDVRDSACRSVRYGGESSPAIAILAVRNEDVQRVVGGAMDDSKNVVLTVKYTENIVPLENISSSNSSSQELVKVPNVLKNTIENIQSNIR